MTEVAARWRKLVQELEPNLPADRTLYVKPLRSPADRIVSDLLAVPGSHPKVLLVGARGGGKSSELRAISRLLESQVRTVEIDLDRSGVSASSVSAFDLLYVCALGLLRLLPDEEAETLFDELARVYAGGQEEQKQRLGTLRTALSGLADFAGMAAKTGLAAGSLEAGAASSAVGAAAIGLRLLVGDGGVVAESSPSGRLMQDICAKIARSVREAVRRPICVVVDGLEKINGEAGERFRQVFEQTRLLADTPWSAVIAAPPCTLTQTNCVDGLGFTTVPVWGFDPDEPSNLRDLLARRFDDADLDPSRCVAPGELERIATESGGLPRHAVQITRRAVLNLLSEKASTVTRNHVDAGIQELGEALGRGLNTDYLTVLKRVARTGMLPGGDGGAATLFADGRILARSPVEGSRIVHFVVHPLLREDVDAFTPDER